MECGVDCYDVFVPLLGFVVGLSKPNPVGRENVTNVLF